MFARSFPYCFCKFGLAVQFPSVLLVPLVAGIQIPLHYPLYSGTFFLNSAICPLTILQRIEPICRKFLCSFPGGAAVPTCRWNPVPSLQHVRSPRMGRAGTKLIVNPPLSSPEECPLGCKQEPAKLSKTVNRTDSWHSFQYRKEAFRVVESSVDPANAD